MDLFARDYIGSRFVLGGTAHLAALACVALLGVWLVRRFRGADEPARRRVRWALLLTLWGNELGYHAWRLAIGTWTPREMLPLHLCSLLVWADGALLLTRSRRLYEFAYFLGLAGATQALLTPDIGPYGFPHYRFAQFFVSHGILVTVALWFTLVEGHRPTWASLARVLGALVPYALVVYGVNSVVGSNYLFVNRKPSTRSLLDILPAWPGYLPFLAAIAVAACVLLYLPFALADARRGRTTPGAAGRA